MKKTELFQLRKPFILFLGIITIISLHSCNESSSQANLSYNHPIVVQVLTGTDSARSDNPLAGQMIVAWGDDRMYLLAKRGYSENVAIFQQFENRGAWFVEDSPDSIKSENRLAIMGKIIVAPY